MPGRLLPPPQNTSVTAVMSSETDTAVKETIVQADVEHTHALHALEASNGNDAKSSKSSAKTRESATKTAAPEIDHVVQGYQPLSKLYSRVSQECFNSLVETITRLSSLPEAPQVNGNAYGATSAVPNATSIQRKLQWLEFANTQRERFIKLLVLSRWSHQVQDISMLIDIVNWTFRQEGHYQDATSGIAQLAHDLLHASVPSPDLDVALEVLTTGASTRLPDLQYIPLPPLEPREILRALKDLNVALHLRLNLHENIPYHFDTFTIQSGRAALVVAGEFEVDLSIADEDVSSQFYFIDIRFLFSPRPEIPSGVLRAQLEGRANDVLASDGLAGCYDFLHDFTLTLKINILRSQALEMSRTSWAGCLKVEQVHRVLVIHYWVDRPYAKSWVEIGVVRGKRLDPAAPWNGRETSRLHLRWLRDGKEDGSLKQELFVKPLSMDRIMRAVIDQHVDYNLRRVYDTLCTSRTEAQRPSSSTRPARVKPLRMLLRVGKAYSSTLLMDVVTGEFAIQPASSYAIHCAEQINALRNPAEEACGPVQQYQARVRQAQSRASALELGWTILALKNVQASSVQETFGRDTLRVNYFSKEYWNAEWATAQSFTAVGSHWWVVKFSTDWRTKRVAVCQSLPIPDGTDDVAAFEKLEALSIAFISFNVLTQSLRKEHIPHVSAASARGFPDLYIEASQLLRGRGRNQLYDQQLHSDHANVVLVEHLGFETATAIKTAAPLPRNIVHVAKGYLDRSARLSTLLSEGAEPGIAIRSDGGFAILLQSALGSAGMLEDLSTRLASLVRLRDHVEMVDKHKFKFLSVSSKSLCFVYGEDEEDNKYTATCTFSASGRIEVSFSPPHTNPHSHLHGLFAKLLSSPRTSAHKYSAFATFLTALPNTLLVLQAIGEIERRNISTTHMRFQIRALDFYRLAYFQHCCAFDISYKRRRDESMWSIAQSDTALPGESPATSTELQEALVRFFKEFKGGVSFRRGIAVSMPGIKEALQKLDETVRGCAPRNTTQPAEEDAATDIVTAKTITRGESPAVPAAAVQTASADGTPAEPEPRNGASSRGEQVAKSQHVQAVAGTAADREVVEID